MKGLGSYLLVCATFAAATAALVGLVLPSHTRFGLWVAAASAWLVQAIASASRARWGRRPERLLTVWGWSTGGRMAALGLIALAVVWSEALDPASTLVGFAGYLFVMLLLEPVLVDMRPAAQTRSR